MGREFSCLIRQNKPRCDLFIAPPIERVHFKRPMCVNHVRTPMRASNDATLFLMDRFRLKKSLCTTPARKIASPYSPYFPPWLSCAPSLRCVA
jgi:hypothetical protein